MKKIPYLQILLFICIVSFVSIPTLVFAQDGATQINNGLKTFSGIVTTFTQTIVRSLATLFATAAMVAFFFGIVQFIWGSRDGDATKAKNGKNFMLWGLIALFVMFSVWGIINYAQRIFGIQGQNTIIIPQIELGNGKKAVNPGSQGLPTGITPSGGESGGYRNGSDIQSDNGAATQSSDCTGKPSGTSCTVSGRGGTCSMSDEGVFGCYVGGGTQPAPCPSEYEVRDANGNCFAPAVY